MGASQDTERILAWLTSHQGSAVKDIAAATGLDGRYVSARLGAAVKAGRAAKDREHGAVPWRWRAICPRS